MNKKKQLFDTQDKNIPYRFKTVRENTGLRPIEFARESGLYSSQVYEVEAGTRNITAEMLLKIEDTFGVNWRYIARGEGVPEKVDKSHVSEPSIPYGASETLRHQAEEIKSLRLEIDRWREKFLEVNDKYMSLLEQVAGKQTDGRDTSSA